MKILLKLMERILNYWFCENYTQQSTHFHAAELSKS